MATFEQRQEAIRRASELVRNGPIWVRRAGDTKVRPRLSPNKQDRSSVPEQNEPRSSE